MAAKARAFRCCVCAAGHDPYRHVNPPHAPSDNLLVGAPEEPRDRSTAPAAPVDAGGTGRAKQSRPGLLQQPRPQGGPGQRRGGYHGDARHRRRHLRSRKPKPRRRRSPAKPPETRQAAAKPALKPSVTEPAAAAARRLPPGLRGCRRSADRAGEFVRQPLLGDEVRPPRGAASPASVDRRVDDADLPNIRGIAETTAASVRNTNGGRARFRLASLCLTHFPGRCAPSGARANAFAGLVAFGPS